MNPEIIQNKEERFSKFMDQMLPNLKADIEKMLLGESVENLCEFIEE